jgi:hypothetical protein
MVRKQLLGVVVAVAVLASGVADAGTSRAVHLVVHEPQSRFLKHHPRLEADLQRLVAKMSRDWSSGGRISIGRAPVEHLGGMACPVEQGSACPMVPCTIPVSNVQRPHVRPDLACRRRHPDAHARI